MPYIPQNERLQFNDVLNNLPEMKTKGQLEYVVFKLMRMYMKTREYRFSSLHDCTYGVMHCADEFRRRFLDKREDKAIEENGDIE